MKNFQAIGLLLRERASFACEYCGVSEIDVGGELTIDHFWPKSKGGPDTLDNLVYCCQRCNQYKAYYWPLHADSPQLWNPRQQSFAEHFSLLPTGMLLALTSTAAFTLERLRLNRPQLINHRLRKQKALEDGQLIEQYIEMITALEHINRQQASIITEQQSLLEQQRNLLLSMIYRR